MINKPENAARSIENLNTAVLLFDAGLRLKYINPAAEDLLAASAKQLVGQTASEVFPAATRFIEALQHALQYAQPYTEREVELPLTNLNAITVDCTVTPINDSLQDNELLIEISKVDRHLRIAREESSLSQYQTIRMLVRGMAHEIKNPLGGLRGAAQLLERELYSEDLKEYTQIIIGEADRLQNLLNRMLGPNTLPQKREINIHEVLERVSTLIEAETTSDITITRDYDPSIPNLFADPEQLIQATLNIARNAVQALEKGGSGSVILRSRTQRQFTIGHNFYKLVIRIDIIDNGQGIAPDMLEKIFYPMVTGRTEGTGLGLSIAQALINQHGGLVECKSQPGETSFTIYLPLENSDEQ